MTLLVVATYPESGGPLIEGEVTLLENGSIAVDGTPLPSAQGITAMLGTACQVLSHLNLPAPRALLAGDIGRGDGTRAVFDALPEVISQTRPDVVAFHYMQPVMALIKKAVAEIDEIAPETVLIADAGGMYAAKAGGIAPRFELMTPDVGEIGFLADPDATHPAYVSHYLFGNEGFDPVALASKAFDSGGSPRVLLIKGSVDHIALDGQIVREVSEPCIPELEAIGGTGDTVAGIATAFIAAGFPTVDAADLACRANRAAGAAMGATPAMHATDLVLTLPEVLRRNLCSWSGVCSIT